MSAPSVMNLTTTASRNNLCKKSNEKKEKRQRERNDKEAEIVQQDKSSPSGEEVSGLHSPAKLSPDTESPSKSADGDTDGVDDKRKKFKTKMSTKDHIVERAAIAKYKLLKKKSSQTNVKPWIVPSRYVLKVPENNFEHAYELTWAGRVFVTFEDANSSRISFIINIIIMVVLVISCIQYIVQSLPSLQVQPDSCRDPVCDNDIDLCPGRVVCEPVPPEWFNYLEMACVIIFTIDYLSRVITCSYVPAR